MAGGDLSRVGVETPDSKDHIGLVDPFRDEMRSALDTEVAQFARRGFEGAKFFFPSRPREMLSQDSCGRRECGAMRFATRFAMAMSDRTIELRETIGNRAAETAALDHVHSSLLRGHDDS